MLVRIGIPRQKGVRARDRVTADLPIQQNDGESQAPNGEETQPPKKVGSYTLYDGKGLYIEVFPNSSKLWRFRYKMPRENIISLGSFVRTTLCRLRPLIFLLAS